MFVNNIQSFVKMIFRIKSSSPADIIVMQLFRNISHFFVESEANFNLHSNSGTVLMSVHQCQLTSWNHYELPVRSKLALELR